MHSPTLRVLLLACGLLVGPATPLPLGASPCLAQPGDARESVLQKVAQEWVDKCGVPGVTLTAIDADGVMLKVAAGVSRLATAEPMKPDDRMFAGSIGKTYFAATILMLVDEGALKLDDPISTIVQGEPWFRGLPNADTLTLRMLLGHTSGIAEHVDDQEFIRVLNTDPMKVWEFGALLEDYVCNRPPLFEAGKGWSYADTNYIVAGLTVERAVNKKMYDMVRDRILTPLQLADTVPSDRPVLPGLIPATRAFATSSPTPRSSR